LTAVAEDDTIRTESWHLEVDMPFTVRCPHCDTLLKVPDKYHYQLIPCPKCKKEIEAISTETLEVGQDFLKELENLEGDMIIDESRPASNRLRKLHKDKPPSKEQDEDNEDLPRLKES
jgi:phage FluMu protein Com